MKTIIAITAVQGLLEGVLYEIRRQAGYVVEVLPDVANYEAAQFFAHAMLRGVAAGSCSIWAIGYTAKGQRIWEAKLREYAWVDGDVLEVFE